ncbi:hypothetical protein [Neoaquamicrobium sediminum]|uniref:hypothetical protein n=1 Tax=Neoaquamicrobium sediminum TaxID=1849104 RepID=UPI001564E45A|nr:hypothetical protein [Mesorhizobium sediminum]NRC56217.1 hypothetical protein [Mesorhizobium sediminum]
MGRSSFAMTNEQYESIRRLILDLKFEVAELRLLIRQVIAAQVQDRGADATAYLETIAQIDIADDLKKFFPDQN